jgi:hypothetical protein
MVRQVILVLTQCSSATANLPEVKHDLRDHDTDISGEDTHVSLKLTVAHMHHKLCEIKEEDPRQMTSDFSFHYRLIYSQTEAQSG